MTPQDLGVRIHADDHFALASCCSDSSSTWVQETLGHPLPRMRDLGLIVKMLRGYDEFIVESVQDGRTVSSMNCSRDNSHFVELFLLLSTTARERRDIRIRVNQSDPETHRHFCDLSFLLTEQRRIEACQEKMLQRIKRDLLMKLYTIPSLSLACFFEEAEAWRSDRSEFEQMVATMVAEEDVRRDFRAGGEEFFRFLRGLDQIVPAEYEALPIGRRWEINRRIGRELVEATKLLLKSCQEYPNVQAYVRHSESRFAQFASFLDPSEQRQLSFADDDRR